MAQSAYITYPKLAGPVAVVGPWGSFFAKPDHRVYPYSLGAMVRTTSSSTTVFTHGQGEIAVNDYLMACSVVSYGGANFFVPDTGRITRVTAKSSSNDEFTIGTARSLVAGEWLLNLEADAAAAPLSAPNYDGSGVVLYTDPVGTTANANKYLATGDDGRFLGWVTPGLVAVDLLISSSAGVPVIVSPNVSLGVEVARP
jgi:hypothetical protein